MLGKIKLKITSGQTNLPPLQHVGRPGIEEFLSTDGQLLLQLARESEIRFGPAFYKAAIYAGDGILRLDFDNRRFFSYGGQGQRFHRQSSPWSPSSSCVVLLELLSRNAAPGAKISRIVFFDVEHQVPLAGWDFDSLISHKMWNSLGNLYLFRDIRELYLFSAKDRRLNSVTASSSPHCFFLKDEFVCVVEVTGEIAVFDAISGARVATDDVSEAGYAVKEVYPDENQSCISVILKSRSDHDAPEVTYNVTVARGN